MESYLGIDIGTTSVKACLVDSSGRVIKEAEVVHNATLPLPDVGHHEQCPKKLLTSVFRLLGDNFSTELDHGRVAQIGVSGQMHGIVLWADRSIHNGADPTNWSCSNLVTWMDQRCDAKFLSTLPKWLDEDGEEVCRIATGYGSATLAWLRTHGLIDANWDRCGTIMDFFIAAITEAGRVPISKQNAYSWGYCNHGSDWQAKVLEDLIPIELLPPVVEPGRVVGVTSGRLATCLPTGIEVTVALGDTQASYLPILRDNEAVLHVGTSAQLAFITRMPLSAAELRRQHPALMPWPYFRRDETLVTVASLNGGNAIDAFAKQVARWSHELYGTPKMPSLRSGVLEEALNGAIPSTSYSTPTLLEVVPLFQGERHDATLRASLIGWDGNASLTQVLQGIARGTIRNLSAMMTPEWMAQCFGIGRICLTNRASQTAYRVAAKTEFAPLAVYAVGDGADRAAGRQNAAYGAALFALQSRQS